ncbi:MAG: hypothetical protein ABSA94_17315, partial [Acidobacteriaceae bacterium]
MSSTSTRKTASAPRVRRGFAPRRRRRMGWLGRGVLACVVGVAVPVTWAVLARTLAPKANTSQRQFDTLVVLGQPTDEDGNPTPWQLASVNEAVREYERGAAPRMIFTGGAVANRFAEARVMARAAEA